MGDRKSQLPLVVALVISCACAGQSGTTDASDPLSSEDPTTGSQASGVVFSVIPAKSSFGSQEPVTFVFRVENGSDADVSFNFTSGCQAFFEIEREGSSLFRQRFHILCAQALTTLDLAPGERRNFPFSWARVDDAGKPVTPGEYQIVAFLANGNSPPVSTSIRLE